MEKKQISYAAFLTPVYIAATAVFGMWFVYSTAPETMPVFYATAIPITALLFVNMCYAQAKRADTVISSVFAIMILLNAAFRAVFSGYTGEEEEKIIVTDEGVKTLLLSSLSALRANPVAWAVLLVIIIILMTAFFRTVAGFCIKKEKQLLLLGVERGKDAVGKKSALLIFGTALSGGVAAVLMVAAKLAGSTNGANLGGIVQLTEPLRILFIISLAAMLALENSVNDNRHFSRLVILCALSLTGLYTLGFVVLLKETGFLIISLVAGAAMAAMFFSKKKMLIKTLVGGIAFGLAAIAIFLCVLFVTTKKSEETPGEEATTSVYDAAAEAQEGDAAGESRTDVIIQKVRDEVESSGKTLMEKVRDRALSILTPYTDSAYQLIRSKQAISLGAFTGVKGSGLTVYLPEENNDLIFSYICEHCGFALGAVLLLLYMLLSYSMLSAAERVYKREKFSAIFLAGLGVMLISQTILATSGCCGLFPIVGVGIPMLSSGDTQYCMWTALMMTCVYLTAQRGAGSLPEAGSHKREAPEKRRVKGENADA